MHARCETRAATVAGVEFHDLDDPASLLDREAAELFRLGGADGVAREDHLRHIIAALDPFALDTRIGDMLADVANADPAGPDAAPGLTLPTLRAALGAVLAFGGMPLPERGRAGTPPTPASDAGAHEAPWEPGEWAPAAPPGRAAEDAALDGAALGWDPLAPPGTRGAASRTLDSRLAPAAGYAASVGRRGSGWLSARGAIGRSAALFGDAAPAQLAPLSAAGEIARGVDYVPWHKVRPFKSKGQNPLGADPPGVATESSHPNHQLAPAPGDGPDLGRGRRRRCPSRAAGCL